MEKKFVVLYAFLQMKKFSFVIFSLLFFFVFFTGTRVALADCILADCISDGHSPGSSWPECHGCDEGLETCNGDGSYCFQSVTNPSGNCSPTCVGTNPTPGGACTPGQWEDPSGDHYTCYAGHETQCGSDACVGTRKFCDTNGTWVDRPVGGECTTQCPRTNGTCGASGTCTLSNKDPLVSPQACLDCLVQNYQATADFIQNNGNQGCTDAEALSHWCNGGIENGVADCAEAKQTTCTSACGLQQVPQSTACFMENSFCVDSDILPGPKCKDGGTPCQDYVCEKDINIIGIIAPIVGHCVSKYKPPACNTTQKLMTVYDAKNRIVVTNDPGKTDKLAQEGAGRIRASETVKFEIRIPNNAPNSIYAWNSFEGGDIIVNRDECRRPDGSRPDPYADGELICDTQNGGSLTWKHYWKNCPLSGCTDDRYLSEQCQNALSFGVDNLPPDFRPDFPCGQINPDDKENAFQGTACPTALGIFKTGSPTDFIKNVFSFVLGVAGALGVILIVYAGYLFMTSRGDKQRIQEAREVLIAAIAGLLFIILSITILRVIGVDVLRIPGFGG